MLHTSRISKEILFYRYKMENWLIKRSTREVRVQIGLLRKISICSFLLRYRSYLTVKSLKEKNNFIPDTQFFLFFFLYINLFRSKYIHKKKKEKEEEKYVYKMVSPKIKKVDGKNKKRIFVNSTVRIDFY